MGKDGDIINAPRGANRPQHIDIAKMRGDDEDALPLCAGAIKAEKIIPVQIRKPDMAKPGGQPVQRHRPE